jgi:hypothetical protein
MHPYWSGQPNAPFSLHADLLATSTDIRAHGFSEVAEKIVFDGDGDKSAKLVPIAELVAGEEESNTGKEDDEDSNNLSGSSGSSGGGARMRREHAAIDAAEALVEERSFYGTVHF